MADRRETGIFRSVIELLSAIVLLGYFVIWITMPTNLYWQKWFPTIVKTFNTYYYGFQGAALLVYFFPVLLVAVLGCIYLHLGKISSNSNNNNKSRKHQLATWKKPMLVKGPLGIVSGTELGFLAMFIALLVWSFSTYLHNNLAKLTPKSTAAEGVKLWIAKLDSVGLSLGLVGNICLSFLFFPVARGSSVLPLFGLTSEASIKYHIWLGHAVMTLFTGHGLCYIIYWIAANEMSEMLKWRKAGISHVAGELSLLAGLCLWAVTFPRLRRKTFELFFYTHHLYILFVVFFLFHVSISFSCIMLPGFYLFIVDRYLRFLQSRTRVRLSSARVLPCQTVELNFSKVPSLSYNPTSIIFVNVPSISKLQWHPFTITSNSNLETENLSVIIKSEGTWTFKLYQMLSSSSIDHLEVSIEGPYGPASTHFLRHDTLVMVSGGSGITPFISIIRELIYQSLASETKIPQVILICSFKNSSDLAMLDLILPILSTPFSTSNLRIKIEAFVTREKEPTVDPNNPKSLRTIWFKPHPTDSPISANLGPNSWLWLGAIISSSFIIFLIIIGLVTRYYIYPIDHNTMKKFSYTIRNSLTMLVICFSIAVTASAAVIWNKSKIKIELNNQIRNIGGSTPNGSPSPFVLNGDRELESLPHQSLVEATNVHYGERPDLKRMLFQCKGESVGVLVCGPKKMRQEVARICSSGLADNLHFESISFSW